MSVYDVLLISLTVSLFFLAICCYALDALEESLKRTRADLASFEDRVRKLEGNS